MFCGGVIVVLVFVANRDMKEQGKGDPLTCELNHQLRLAIFF